MTNTKEEFPDEFDLIDHEFNPWRIPVTTSMKALVDKTIHHVEEYECQNKLRKRKRKAADLVTFKATISAIVCDLAHHHLSGYDGAIHITRSNAVLRRKTRYKAPALHKTLPALLDILSEAGIGLVKQSIGH